jgi:hypothetical protein
VRVKTYSKAVLVSSNHPSVPWPGTGYLEAMKMTVAKPIFTPVPGRDVLGFSLSSRTARRRTRICRETLEDGIGDAPLEAPQRLLAGFALRDLLAVVPSAPSVRVYLTLIAGLLAPVVI